MTVSRFGSATRYSRTRFRIDRIDKLPMKISYPGFLSSLRFLSLVMAASPARCGTFGSQSATSGGRSARAKPVMTADTFKPYLDESHLPVDSEPIFGCVGIEA